MILVVGGAGYVGSHMVQALLDAGRGVVVLDDLSTGHRELARSPRSSGPCLVSFARVVVPTVLSGEGTP